MLTPAQNEALTHILPGTRMGELMRRYWHPLAATAELAANPVKAVTLLGESLVLFRDKGGGLGLLAEACVHRGASLAAGHLEDQGLRCAAHGWLYNLEGNCLDQPMEPLDPAMVGQAKTKAYPVEELGGLVFAYLGPEPRPLLPRYNVLVWDDAVRETNGTMVPCNWLQVMENLLDPLHVEFLHGRYFAYVLARKGGNQHLEFRARHYPAPMKKIGFDLFDHGIIERHVFRGEDDPSWVSGTPSFFPSTSLLSKSEKGGSVIFVVPIDETHTWFVLHMAERRGAPVAQASIPFVDVPGVDARGQFITDSANGQDHMVVVTQGSIAQRDQEHLGAADTGIVLYRDLLVEQMERCESGQDPMNVRRDPAENQIIDIPDAARRATPDDVARWSRQRKRWAARHSRNTQVVRPPPSTAQEAAAGERAPPAASMAQPAMLRGHREVVVR